MTQNNEDTRPMTVGDWMLTLIILALPLVNIVMYLVWAFGSTGNVNRRTYCRASIYLFLIIFGIALFVAVITAALGALLSQ